MAYLKRQNSVILPSSTGGLISIKSGFLALGFSSEWGIYIPPSYESLNAEK